MDQPSAEEDLAFVQDFVAKALAAGVDEAQARLSYGEGVEVDFGTSRLSMLRTAREDDILLTVFKSNRKGSATITGRDADAAALSEILPAEGGCIGSLVGAVSWSGSSGAFTVAWLIVFFKGPMHLPRNGTKYL